MALHQRAIGRRIAELRAKTPYTQEAMANKLHMSLRGYQKWESGEAAPAWPNLVRLADVLGVRVEQITGGPEKAEPAQLDRIEAKLDLLLAVFNPTELPPEGAREAYERELEQAAEGPPLGERTEGTG